MEDEVSSTLDCCQKSRSFHRHLEIVLRHEVSTGCVFHFIQISRMKVSTPRPIKQFKEYNTHKKKTHTRLFASFSRKKKRIVGKMKPRSGPFLTCNIWIFLRWGVESIQSFVRLEWQRRREQRWLDPSGFSGPWNRFEARLSATNLWHRLGHRPHKRSPNCKQEKFYYIKMQPNSPINTPS